MDLQLAGKTALITGSSSGIGVAIAQMLAAEGVAVDVNGRNAERCEKVAAGIRAAGGKAGVAVGDIGTDEGAKAVADAAIAAFGGIDILVNNAGGSAETQNHSWFSATPQDWIDTYQRNVIGSVRLIHALVEPMKAKGWGRIINIGTGAGITPTSGQADYGPAKAAMINFSLGLSKAISGSGVTSNVVSPGMIRTEGLVDFLKAFAQKRGWGDDITKAEEYVMKGCGQTVNRVGEVRDIAFAVTTLASPMSDFINGTNIHVDGGISPSIN